MPPLTIRTGWVIPESELSWRFSRAGGPGGQSVNTSDSRVELSFDLERSPTVPEPFRRRATERLAGRLRNGVVTVVAEEERSQLRNRSAARDRLADLLRTAAAAPPRSRRATRPTRGSVERRLAGKKRRAAVKKGRRGDPDS